MVCDDCKGTGDSGVGKPCFRCDGTGELCDRCGESTAVCDGTCGDEEDDASAERYAAEMWANMSDREREDAIRRVL